MLHPDVAREIYCELRIPATVEYESLLSESTVAGIRASSAYTLDIVLDTSWLFAAKS